MTARALHPPALLPRHRRAAYGVAAVALATAAVAAWLTTGTGGLY